MAGPRFLSVGRMMKLSLALISLRVCLTSAGRLCCLGCWQRLALARLASLEPKDVIASSIVGEASSGMKSRLLR